MKLLLDSHVLLWALVERRKLTSRIAELLENEASDLHVSTASIWELSIKVAKGKLSLPGSSVRSVYEQIDLRVWFCFRFSVRMFCGPNNCLIIMGTRLIECLLPKRWKKA